MAEQIVLDLETQKGFYEVGGRQNLEQMKVSVCGIYSYEKKKFLTFREDKLQELEPILAKAERIIGFNIKNFDFLVLQPYLSIELNNLPFLDILEEVNRSIGHRIKLNSLANTTLAVSKSGNGLDALRYFREKKWNLLEKYCTDDVRITRDLYDFAREKGYLVYHDGARAKRIMVNWDSGFTVPEAVRTSYRQKARLLIEYPSIDEHGEFFTIKRKIEVYYIKDDLMAAFCFLRNQQRTFRISRVVNASLTEENYKIPKDFKPERWQEKIDSYIPKR